MWSQPSLTLSRFRVLARLPMKVAGPAGRRLSRTCLPVIDPEAAGYERQLTGTESLGNNSYSASERLAGTCR
jgi:hypothetical protein